MRRGEYTIQNLVWEEKETSRLNIQVNILDEKDDAVCVVGRCN